MSDLPAAVIRDIERRRFRNVIMVVIAIFVSDIAACTVQQVIEFRRYDSATSRGHIERCEIIRRLGGPFKGC